MKEIKQSTENLEAIISKLKKQGIEAGETEKERILSEAKQKAEKIIAEAETKSNGLFEKAKAEAEQLEKNAKSAIKQASRDVIEATKISILNKLKAAFGNQCEKLFTEEQYAKELLKAVIKSIEGDKKIEVAPDLAKKMQSFLVESKLAEGIEIKPLSQSETKISVSCTGKEGVNFVLSSKDIEDAMFTLMNKELVELVTKNEEE
jgi:V/A-type H+-transporting ATPase subunit E